MRSNPLLTLGKIAVPVLTVLLASALNSALSPLMKPFTFSLFIAAVTYSTLREGQFAGLFATFLSMLITTYFFLDPVYSLYIDIGGFIKISAFVLVCFFLIQVVVRMRTVEAAALNSATLIESLVEFQDEPISILDSEWKFVSINLACSRYLNLDREKLIGKVVWDLFPTSRGTIFEEYYRRAVRDRGPVRFEAYHRSSNQWLFVRAVPYDDGLIVSFRGLEQPRTTLPARPSGFQQGWKFELFEPVSVRLPASELIEAIYRESRLIGNGRPLSAASIETLKNDQGYIGFGTIFPDSEATNLDALSRFIHSGFQLDHAKLANLKEDGTTTTVEHRLVGEVESGLLVSLSGQMKVPIRAAVRRL